MKYIEEYKTINIFSENEVFENLIANLRETIYTYDFFVAGEKVKENTLKIEVVLNILNTLIGKDDVAGTFKKLIKQYPEIVSVIPLLIAFRKKSLKILDMDKEIEYSFYKNKKYNDEEIEKIVLFADKVGLLKIFEDKSIKNLVDYYIGVEVGLDTNARKNRTGKIMENLIGFYINNICDKYGYKYLFQATVSKIKSEFGVEVSTDKSDRKFDFVIYAKEKIYLIEVNYFSDHGSKLKAVAGEFSNLFKVVKNENVEFIWITDGKGWLKTKKPLLEAFSSIDYILNINMVDEGLLETILVKNL